MRRSLILSERISPEADTFTRTIETNRAIFWRRALFLAALPILYFAGADLLFGLAPADALAALDAADRALQDLKAGRFDGAAVLIP